MDDVRVVRRIWYSLVAWFAGQGALGLIVFSMTMFGGSRAGLTLALDMSATYLILSLLIGFFGWLLVGLPIAVFWPVRKLRRTPYYGVFLIGIAAGSLIVFLVLAGDARAHGEVISHYLLNSGLLFICAGIVSPVCCLVYKRLIRPRSIGVLSAVPH